MIPDEQPNHDEIDSYLGPMARWLLWCLIRWPLLLAAVAGAWWGVVK